MSKPRYKWWGYARGMVEYYPDNKARYADAKATQITVLSPKGARGND